MRLPYGVLRDVLVHDNGRSMGSHREVSLRGTLPTSWGCYATASESGSWLGMNRRVGQLSRRPELQDDDQETEVRRIV
jgi:hypothetical protein